MWFGSFSTHVPSSIDQTSVCLFSLNQTLLCISVWPSAALCYWSALGADRGVQTLRELMITFLQNHTGLGRPDHCPPLEPFK